MLTHPNITIPKRGQIYSVNDARYFDCEWSACSALLSALHEPAASRCVPRYIRHMTSCAAQTHAVRADLAGGCTLHFAYV